MIKNQIKTYAFIDAANIIYGTRDEGWKVDFAKLFKYLKERYKAKRIFYFAGLDEKNLKQLKFYDVLKAIGYELITRKVKTFSIPGNKPVRKANCDVDLTFTAMRYQLEYERVLFLSGDGDFDVLLQYFIENGKTVLVYANAKRTAKEIKRLEGVSFNDLSVLKPIICFDITKRRRLRTSPPHVL